MEHTLYDMFPQMRTKLDPTVFTPTVEHLQNNRFFQDILDDIVQDHRRNANKSSKNQPKVSLRPKDIAPVIERNLIIPKVLSKVVPVKVSKGTVIYTLGMPPSQAYFLVHGSVTILSKKNTIQKLEPFDGHTIYKAQHRVNYLVEEYGIDPKHCSALQNAFFEEKMIFNYLPFNKVGSEGYFGFREVMRGCLRTKMAIATEDCILLKISKNNFDKYLKEFEAVREQFITYRMLGNLKQEIIEDIEVKFVSVFNSAQILSLDADEYLIREGQFANGLYYVLNGEISVEKTVKIEVPKKYLSNENRGSFAKELNVRLHKIVSHSFVGDIQPLLSKKTRQFSYKSVLNGTLLLKIDSTSFLKMIAEAAVFERDLTLAAKHKYTTTMDAYLRLKTQMVKTYFNQFEELDHRKTEKNVANLLNNDVNFKQKELFELFKREGMFYRDTFERLEGFQEFESKYDTKRGAINRHRINSVTQVAKSPQKGKRIKDAVVTPVQSKGHNSEQASPNDSNISFEAAKRTLMSPSKTNGFQLLTPQLHGQLSPIPEQRSSTHLKKKRLLVNKFQEMRVDQSVKKRVLIQNGSYNRTRETNKDNRMKAIVNHKFDQIVKECMGRRNVSLRRAMVDQRDDILKEEFRRTVSSLPQRAASVSAIQSSLLGENVCIGTSEMKKKMDRLKFKRSPRVMEKDDANEDFQLQDCIGYNRKPKSSEIKARSSMLMSQSRVSKDSQKSPSRIVLLNHMMKPMTYTSQEL